MTDESLKKANELKQEKERFEKALEGMSSEYKRIGDEMKPMIDVPQSISISGGVDAHSGRDVRIDPDGTFYVKGHKMQSQPIAMAYRMFAVNLQIIFKDEIARIEKEFGKL